MLVRTHAVTTNLQSDDSYRMAARDLIEDDPDIVKAKADIEAEGSRRDLAAEGYGWLITKDTDPISNMAGKAGPRRLSTEKLAALQRGEGLQFKMYDDDDNLCYGGIYNGPHDQDMFGPLDDFGHPNYGCTRIDYLINGKWTTA